MGWCGGAGIEIGTKEKTQENESREPELNTAEENRQQKQNMKYEI